MTDSVDWTHGAAHMWAKHKVTVTEVDEAVADIDALWFDPDPHRKSAQSVRVIGYSPSRQAILTVILVHRDGGRFPGRERVGVQHIDRRRYERGE